MAREIDEAFIDEAIERYQRIDARLAEFRRVGDGDGWSLSARRTVWSRSWSRSPATIRDVVIDDRLLGRNRARTSRASVRLAVTAAADAAEWARAKLHAETFSDYAPLTSR